MAKSRTVTVTDERLRVQALIAQAQATESVLRAAEEAVTNLNTYTGNFTK